MSQTKVDIRKFGATKDGYEVKLYTLSSNHVEVGIISYGAAISFLNVPDKDGCKDDIVTGFDTLEDYCDKRTYFGCIVGRVANRIAKGKYTIDGKSYALPINNGPNTLHGGLEGFDKKIWEAETSGESVIFSLTSPDGDEGHPGEMSVSVSYTLQENILSIKYHATTTKHTPINLTNHSFFNLGGHKTWDTDLSNHEISIPADSYLPADNDCLVTGEVRPVDGTVFDLRNPVTLTEDLLSKTGVGFDHNFCLQRNNKRNLHAKVKHMPSGRILIVESTQPGCQLYTGNFLSGISGKHGASYTKHSAFCLESQNWPDAINNPGSFPDSVLLPNKEYSHSTWWTFDTA
ncbi:galactose mutarotase-like isoform X2 [Clavelina lepadiformis]|uniref:Aldose 1-epimerase n=1 Tax=Clavelina lepadiformis TaxID=159417 RepID=A0ABP0GNN6_CLALP